MRGGKLLILGLECQNTDYSKFFLPFTTNNPGALGANGTLQDVEENSLSSSDPASPAFVNAASSAPRRTPWATRTCSSPSTPTGAWT